MPPPAPTPRGLRASRLVLPLGSGSFRASCDRVRTMLAALGLALGVIGAAVLSVGLFRNSKPLLLGWARDPLQAATDQACGVTGFLFLGSGFILQALPSVGVKEPNVNDACIRSAAIATLVLGLLVAWLLYECVRRCLFSGESAYTARTYQPFKARLVLRPGIDRSGRWPIPRLWQVQEEEHHPPD